MPMTATKRKDSRGRNLKAGESQRPDGLYRYRYVDATGKRRDVYSRRLIPSDRLPSGCKFDLSLREKEQQIHQELEQNYADPQEPVTTLNDLFDLYISTKPYLKGSTRTNYLYMYNRYVRNTLGKNRIQDIRYSAVFGFYCSLIDQHGLKPNTVEIIHCVLHPTFRLAVRDEYIRRNPSDEIVGEIKKAYSWETPKRRALTIPEQEAFIRFLTASPVYRCWLPLMTVFLGTGCRAGEVIGLTWKDCDFEKGIISINHSMIYRHFAGEENMCFHVSKPKTRAGIRQIPMLSEVRKALVTEYNRQMAEGFCQVEVDGYSGFVFQNQRGDLLSDHCINRAIKRICKAYNKEESERAVLEQREPLLLPPFTAHSLRHTFCTRFCENETNLKVIQEIMGHADIETTLNVYAEATMEKKQESFVNLEGKIKIG